MFLKSRKFLIFFLFVYSNVFADLKFIKFLDPVSSFLGATEDFFDKSNVYNARQKDLNNFEEFLKKDLPIQEQEVLAEIKESKEKLEIFVEKFKTENGVINDEKIMTSVNEIFLVMEEEKAEISRYKNDIVYYIDFLKKNDDLVDEKVANRFFANIENQSTFSLQEMQEIENKISKCEEEKKALILKKNSLESQKEDDKTTLELLKKDPSSFLSKNSSDSFFSFDSPLFNNDSILNISEDVFKEQIERKLLQSKIHLLTVRSDRIVGIVKIVDSEIELLKIKLKNILEPALKKIQLKLFVSDLDVKNKQKVIASEEKITSEKKTGIIEAINQANLESSKLRKKIDETKILLEHKKANNTHVSDVSQLKADIFSLESSILKLNYEFDLLNQQKVLLDLNRKILEIELDHNNFIFLKVQAYHYYTAKTQSAAEPLIFMRDVTIQDLIKKHSGIPATAASVESFLEKISSAKKVEIKARRDQLIASKNTLFLGHRSSYQENMDCINLCESLLNDLIKKFYESKLLLLDFDAKRRALIDDLENLRKKINAMVGLKNIYSRSDKAISYSDLQEALTFGITFIKTFTADSLKKLNVFFIVKTFQNVEITTFLGFLFSFTFFLLLGFILWFFILYSQKKLVDNGFFDLKQIENKYFLLFLVVWNLLVYRFFWVYLFVVVHFLVKSEISIFSFSVFKLDPFYISLFYLLAIFFIGELINKFLRLFIILNQRSRFLFFNERNSSKNIFLLSFLMYLTGFFFPMYMAVSSYSLVFKNSSLTPVLVAAYSLLAVLIFFFFLDKEEILYLIPGNFKFLQLIKDKIDKFYYPIVLFCFCIYIIFNPYVGYINLGWYLLYTVPTSFGVVYLAYLFQSYTRKQGQTFFLMESDIEGEYVEKFENAKICHGIFVILSFAIICLVTFMIVSKIWFGEFYLWFLWKKISETWTIPINDKCNFGIVELLIFSTILLIGYFIAMFFDRVVLRKMFDVFKIETGLENSISKIFQYIFIVASIVSAFVSINLLDLVKYLLFAVAVGILLGMRDQISDIFAGILILLERQFEMGHFIEFDQGHGQVIRGTVHFISIRSTTIRTMRNFFISIPNRLLISHPIINWGAGRMAVGMEFSIKIAYGPDPAGIVNLIKQIVYENPAILKIPMAVVRLEEFSEYGMVFYTRAFLSARKVREQWDIAASIRTELMQIFKAKGIELAYPNAIIHLQQKRNRSKDEHHEEDFF